MHKHDVPEQVNENMHCMYFQGLDKEVTEHERNDTDHHLKKVIEFTNKTSNQNQSLMQEMEVGEVTVNIDANQQIKKPCNANTFVVF